MYRIAVCDDEQADACYVEGLIQKWAQARAVMVQVELFPSAEAFLFRYEEDRTFDMLFLDIEMGAAGSDALHDDDGIKETAASDRGSGMKETVVPYHENGTKKTAASDHGSGMKREDMPDRMNGIDLALRIREREHGRAVQIVFVTGYMDYIEKGYDVEALHYLLKPVTQERLSGVLDRAAQRVQDRERELCLQTPEGIVCIPVSEIRYLEVRRNYVTVHGDEDYTVRRTLGELERELDESFFRTGRSYIVNLRFVKKITRTQAVLKDGAQIPLSRGLYEDINRALIRYF